MPRRGGPSPATVSGCRRRSSAGPALERERLTVYWQWRSTRDRWSKLGAGGTGRQVDQLRAAVAVDSFTAVPAARLAANRVQVVARRRVALDAVRHAALALPPPTVDCAIVHKFTLINSVGCYQFQFLFTGPFAHSLGGSVADWSGSHQQVAGS